MRYIIGVFSVILIFRLQVVAQHQVGIGAMLKKDLLGYAKVTLIINNSPAKKGGLQIGDKISHVDGEDVTELPIEAIIDKIKGMKGQEVVFKVLRGDDDTAIEIHVVRDELDPEGLKRISSNGTFYFNCEQGDCANGYGLMRSSSGEIWEGNFKGGRLHGKGINTLVGGMQYLGTYRDGARDGAFKVIYPSGREIWLRIDNNKANSEGTVIYPNGDRYDGGLSPSWLPMGEGRKVLANGFVIQGYWLGERLADGCQSGDCRNGQGVLLESDKTKYEGMFVDGKKHGKGKLTYIYEGDTYEGEFTDGKCHGFGKYTWKEGSLKTYEGQFTEEYFDGKGKMVFRDGRVYEGDFAKEKGKHGKGTFSWPNGDKYVGEFREDQITGTGIYTFKGGNQYSGEWLEGQKHGQGALTFASIDEKYIGSFRDDKYNGQGKYYYPDGRVYKGEFKDDKLQYPYEILRPNGKVTIMDGKQVTNSVDKVSSTAATSIARTHCASGDCKNGFGVYKWSDGAFYEGNFRDGKFHGRGRIVRSDGSIYVGEFVNDRLPVGVFIQPGKFDYKGEMDRNGRFEGRGKLTFADGGYLVGTFRQDNLHGRGVRYLVGEGKETGLFVNGVLHEGTITDKHWQTIGKVENGKFRQLTDAERGYFGSSSSSSGSNNRGYYDQMQDQVDRAFGKVRLRGYLDGGKTDAVIKRW
jgi:hypothetical protein